MTRFTLEAEGSLPVDVLAREFNAAIARILKSPRVSASIRKDTDMRAGGSVTYRITPRPRPTLALVKS